MLLYLESLGVGLYCLFGFIEIIKDGDLVKVEGDNGVVRIIEG